MNKLICTLFAVTLSASTYSVMAATASPEESSNIGVEETPQQIEQSNAAGKKTMHHRMRHSEDMKMMDSNNDGMISKDEYMSYQEQKFSKMHQSPDGMVSMKDMEIAMNGTTRGSNKLQPSDPKSKAPGN